MPTYAFTCPQGHQFDVFERKISPKLKSKCPTCGKMATRQISGGSGFHLKGSGFYGTDYKSKGESGDKKEREGQKEHKEQKEQKEQKGPEVSGKKDSGTKGEGGASSAPAAPSQPKKDSA